MAKKKSAPSSNVTIAGLTPDAWKHHMDTDEDWTERLDGASEASVREVIGAFDHADADVRALACNLAYAIGVDGLGTHAQATVERLAVLAQSDPKPKVRNRARMIHEDLAAELERVAIRRELPWLVGYSSNALPQAIAALDDTRTAVRLQVYLWLVNASAIPADRRTQILAKLEAACERESDEVPRRAAQLALAHIRG